jgi:diphthamide synthase (EF-2-diphthine--ammonia ligase)
MSTAVYWSGGKDCVLALLASLAEGMSVDYLVTFIGENTEFLCHPMSIMKEQARQLGIRHILHVIREPYLASYAHAICQMKREYGIHLVITGDLIRNDGEKFEQYWLNVLCMQAKTQLFCPMGKFSRKEVLQKVLDRSLNAQITGVHTGILPVDLLWRSLGLQEIGYLLRLNETSTFDLCGESGEYHTTVLSCEHFSIPMPTLGTLQTHHEVAYMPLLRTSGVCDIKGVLCGKVG